MLRKNISFQRFLCFLFGAYFSLACSASWGQGIRLSGQILASPSQKPIPFAHVIINQNQLVVNSDLDGKFEAWAKLPIHSIAFSCIGYETFSYTIQTSDDLKPFNKPLTIYLVEKAEALQAVTIISREAENPAHAIIRKVVANRKKNNPEKNLSFKYIAYNKFWFGTNLTNEQATEEQLRRAIYKDSLAQAKKATQSKQTLAQNPPISTKKRQKLYKDTLVKPDKSELNAFKHFKQHHILMSESITERKFMPPNFDKEIVLQNKVSGLQNPTFVSVATDFQPFGFYNDYLTILNKNYLNPISDKSTERYYFELKDTLLQQQDTIFVIAFRPQSNKKFQGLEGVLYVHTYQYALQNVRAASIDSTELVQFKIEQQYQRIGRHWFPTQLHADLVFKELGNNKRMQFLGSTRTYIQDLEINPLLKHSDFDDLSIAFLPTAHLPQDSLWEKYRATPLQNKDLKTYRYLDSLGKKYKFDKWIGLTNTLAMGKLPFHFLNFDFSKTLTINGFEGVRLGFGIATNHKLWQKHSIGAYYGYGLKDTRNKVGLWAKTSLPQFRNLVIQAQFFHEVFEPAQMIFAGKRPLLAGEEVRRLLAYRMNLTETWEIAAEAKPYHNLTTTLKLQRNWVKPLYDYAFRVGSELQNAFNTTEIHLQLHYSFKERYAQLAQHKVFVGAEYPIISMQFTKAISQFLSSDFTYTKLGMRAEYRWRNALTKDTYFHANWGRIWGDVPYPYLLQGAGSYVNTQLSILVPNTFQTMNLYEFVANRFWQLFVNQKLTEPLIRTRWSAPELYAVQGIAWGKLDNPENHVNVPMQDYRKGFWETGLLVKNILRMKQGAYYLGYDAGIFARYGAYARPKWYDNFTFRIGLNISF